VCLYFIVTKKWIKEYQQASSNIFKSPTPNKNPKNHYSSDIPLNHFFDSKNEFRDMVNITTTFINFQSTYLYFLNIKQNGLVIINQSRTDMNSRRPNKAITTVYPTFFLELKVTVGRYYSNEDPSH
jgi:hypothetical protein